jgi:tryptophan synthase alpha chain
MRRIARASSGFIYMVSVTGVTGARAALPPELRRNLQALRAITTRPVCVGFGIGTPEQARAIGRLADGVAVGSALVSLVERHAGSDRLLPEVGRFVGALKAALRNGAA